MTAREAAFKAIGAYRRKKTWPDSILGELKQKNGINEREMALAFHIVNGVLQNKKYCDYIASCFSKIELKKLQPQVLDILRISIYQIIFLTKVPHSAAVNEGVKLAQSHVNPKAANFINAVLRKVADKTESGGLPEVTGENEYRILSIKYSHPEWLVRELGERLGISETEELLRANNSQDIPIAAQVNTLATDVDKTIELLLDDGVEAVPHEWLENCLLLKNAGSIERLEAFKKGFIYIQDPAAHLAALAASPSPGAFLIDGCAAPGGKSFTSAICMKNRGQILACDLGADKLRKTTDGAKRLGIGIIDTAELDATVKQEEYVQKADIVIADVPCSGFGAIRKKPEIRYKTQSEIAELPEIQTKILRNLSSYVKPGGTLIYSTCTLLKSENEDVIEEFLSVYPMFNLEPFSLPGIGEVPEGKITLWPHQHKTDGFFICKLRRSSRSVEH